MKLNDPNKFLFLGMVVLALFLAACGGGSASQAFKHPEADLSAITRVAIIPFENYTTTQYAGEKVSTIYMSELLMSIDVDVVEPGEVSRALQTHSIIGGEMGQKEIELVGGTLKADTLIFGSVQEYGRERFRTENYPVISVNVRWVDVQTGTIILTGTASAKGNPTVPIIDVGDEQLFSVLTVQVCRELIDKVR